MIRKLIAAALFIVFVPGVFFTFPKGQSHTVVLVVHAILFAITTHVVMKAIVEQFGNYGPTCPNGYVMKEDGTCIPTGHPTFNPESKLT